MGVARGRCLAAGVVAGVLACVLAVAPSASADPSSVAGGASVSSGAGVSGGVVQAPSAGSPSPSSSPSVSDGLGLAGSPSRSQWVGVPDPSSWLRNVKVSDVGAHTADVSFDWDLSYLLNGKQNGKTTTTTQLKDGKRIDTYSWEVAYAGNNIRVSRVSGDYVSDNGDGLFDIDPAKDVDGVCFTIGVGRATSVTPTDAANDDYYGTESNNVCDTGGTSDDKLTASDYRRIYGTRTEKLNYGTVTEQSFYRYFTPSLAEAGAKPGTLKGHYDMALIGLDANTLYGNTKEPDSIYSTYWFDGNQSTRDWSTGSYYNAVDSTASDLYKKGVRKNTKIDVRRLKVGVALYLKDSSKAVQQCKAGVDDYGEKADWIDKTACNTVFPVVHRQDQPHYVDGGGYGGGSAIVPDDYLDFVTAVVPDFRTGVEPVVASSTSGLPASVKGGVSVDASVVKQGSVARFYVNGLKAAARGKADASSLFWYAYIYSSPQRLTGPDGAPYVTVRKDSAGRYYFDAIVPAGLKAGSHTVSLVDGSGACQGWTPVTVTAADTAVMFRLYNRFTGEHFYTSSLVERDSLVKVGWRSEGTGWVAPVSGAPVYRLYNPYAPGGDHHYTMSVRERDALVKAGWRAEGIGWYSGGSVRVLREYNPYARTGTHNYTTDPREDTALVKAGWRAEGIGWYAVKAK
ncbi:hypothetical protein D805_0401 [Bifidobacterium thermophilum RBL67]|uniref:DUF5648 domain-containing protein n=2 Tax=Bifidobacterium thermophilum TaxID=33905 RepID=M4RDN3_9BIFI|nr:hypothetical protein [Bifidobacterium thermophilum]AGH40668.1 hypothetical protein D805_0401 [Bifidobacterium thermophilum RBL67]